MSPTTAPVGHLVPTHSDVRWCVSWIDFNFKKCHSIAMVFITFISNFVLLQTIFKYCTQHFQIPCEIIVFHENYTNSQKNNILRFVTHKSFSIKLFHQIHNQFCVITNNLPWLYTQLSNFMWNHYVSKKLYYFTRKFKIIRFVIQQSFSIKLFHQVHNDPSLNEQISIILTFFTYHSTWSLDFTHRQTNHVGLPKFVSWNLVEPRGTSWEPRGTSWEPRGDLVGWQNCFVEPRGTSWESRIVSWNLVEPRGTSWDFVGGHLAVHTAELSSVAPFCVVKTMKSQICILFHWNNGLDAV